jgi:Fe-S cluster biogenesis protein NfuA
MAPGAVKRRGNFLRRMASIREEIERVVRDVLAPLVGADGGEIWLVSAEESAVVLHLGGRFAGCPGNTLAKRRIIEPAIQTVAPRAQITVTSGALVPDGAQRILV